MHRRLAILLACLVALILIFTGGSSWFLPLDVEAGLTISPSISFTLLPTFTVGPILLPVTIPDANLNIALHTACGKPLGETIYRHELAALTGSLLLNGRNIANLEGIQYCSNITYLDASQNPLSTLPAMNGMTNLGTLRLSGCQFTAVPAVIRQIPKLVSLSLTDNQITAIDEISGAPKLKYLALTVNRISALPTTLNLPELLSLDLSDNRLAAIPACILALPKLESLYMNNNEIAEIPAGISGLTHLDMLCLSGNAIRSLPGALASSPLRALYIRHNLISTLPQTVLDAPNLDILDIGLNRLTAVPQKLTEITFEWLDVAYNYLDITPGQANRTLLDGVTAVVKNIEPQLTPIQGLQADVTDSSITLSWQMCPDTVTSVYSTKVKNYIVYLNQSGSLISQAVLGPGTVQYQETGLASATERKYSVAVVYEIIAPMTSTTTRHYTGITAVTATPTAVPTPSETTPETTEPSGSETTLSGETSVQPTAQDTSVNTVETTGAENRRGLPQLPGWLIFVGAGLAGASIVAAVFVVIATKKKS
jgi:Leucine-rich repeat (LRR) protein